MELYIQWFWIIKLLVALAVTFSIYKTIMSGFKSKYWIAMTIIGIILYLIAPVKMDTGTRTQQIRINTHIESTKAIPPKVTDDSYTLRKQNIGITEKELP